MAKEEKCDCEAKLTWQNGFKFGFGVVLAQILGLAIIALIVWLIILVSHYTGSIL